MRQSFRGFEDSNSLLIRLSREQQEQEERSRPRYLIIYRNAEQDDDVRPLGLVRDLDYAIGAAFFALEGYHQRDLQMVERATRFQSGPNRTEELIGKMREGNLNSMMLVNKRWDGYVRLGERCLGESVEIVKIMPARIWGDQPGEELFVIHNPWTTEATIFGRISYIESNLAAELKKRRWLKPQVSFKGRDGYWFDKCLALNQLSVIAKEWDRNPDRPVTVSTENDPYFGIMVFCVKPSQESGY